MIPYNWINEAANRIEPHINRTPLTFDPDYKFYLKWESHQITGSFKPRGAINKVLALQPGELQNGLVAASAGNHGQGVALAGKLVSAPVKVFCSDHAVPSKIQAMQALGADVRTVPGGYREAENTGKKYARQHGATWISPYNDGYVIAGQGTIGLEVYQELPPLEESEWFVPVGGGGLISGIGVSLEKANTKIRLIGVQSVASSFFHGIYYQGTQEGIVELPSLADGLAGPVEENSISIAMVRRLVDKFTLVTEEEIRGAIAFAWERYRERIEGSAAAALAAALSEKVRIHPAVIVISGGNIQPEVHAKIISGQYHPQTMDINGGNFS
jgi:threonine dehydratase